MPMFFDPNNLSPEQQARWGAAEREYQRIQVENLRRELERMTPELRALRAARLKHLLPALDDVPVDVLMENLPDKLPHLPAKSALFARLLDGKAALPFPPPTSYSYPWYEVIEGQGPFKVLVDVGDSAHWGGRATLGINQCPWLLVSASAAAQRLLGLDKRLRQTAEPEDARGLSFRYDWTGVLPEVHAAYQEAPEFEVQFGDWPACRLEIGRNKSSCRRDYAERAVAGRGVEALHTTGTVLATYNLQRNAVIGETLSKAKHPEERLREQKAKVDLPLNEVFVAQLEARLAEDVRDYELNPTANDFVELHFDDWLLVKAQ